MVAVSARAAARLRDGHVWVYRSDVTDPGTASAGSLVTVKDHRGKPLGAALYSSSSQIALRMVANRPLASRAEWLTLLRQRVAAAVAYRKELVKDSDAYRVLFSEADLLPGVIADRYNDVLTLQALTQAMDADDLRSAVVDELVTQTGVANVVERVEPRIRELEALPAKDSGLLRGTKTETAFTLNGLKFAYQALGGQKTGAFLDQRENYAAAARHARGRALDVFCYEGGFALHLARVCESVTGVDSSLPALEAAERNQKLNEPAVREIEWLEANAFDLLKDYSTAGEQFDTIVLDPPAFARSKRTLETAIRGYKELNLRALKMLKSGGVLVTCSCSHHVSEADFLAMLAAAAADAHRNLRLIEKRGAAQDHPMLLSVPETAYLKCVVGTAL
ncbi:MAG: class I SAM-dependent rRNA methyltransferase [Candidatus Koribacter versatilis]|uniref:Class I SAM-dependent rRNA methyltransferase n=1 Tax=Candidatus Korobacter versatilis TaxID=658062 RepID=A0A932EPF5_9BACT|nr:class I SAM-dependent rRNA methyltransferase [Candidatus Koribacter versatilis]